MSKNIILVCDDDADIRNMIGIYLRNEGFETVCAEDGAEAVRIIDETNVDLVVLDIMMPGLDGIKACHLIREKSNIPVIFLSAKSEETDKILGLSFGGDDYITKPFNPLELIARVKAALRRRLYYDMSDFSNKDSEKAGSIKVHDIIIDIDRHKVLSTDNDREIVFTKTEFEIFRLFAENRGMIFSIDFIMDRIWPETAVTPNTAMVHIRKIREKLDDDAKNPKYIKTVWGVGYRMD